MEVLILFLICAFLSYVIGGINPAFLLGKIFRRIDIREYGTKNAGTGNAFLVLGKIHGIITAFFDASKGIISVILSSLLFVHFFPDDYFKYGFLILLSGFFAILGHDFPFYLKFRGGRGAATAYGLVIFLLVMALIHTQYSGILFIFFAAILFLSLITQIITRSGFFTFAFTFPFLLVFIVAIWAKSLVGLGEGFFEFGDQLLLFSILFLIYIFMISVKRVKEKGGVSKDIKFARRKDVPKIKVWRKTLRIFGVALPVLYFLFTKNLMLIVLSVLFLFFILIDVVRKSKKIKSKIYKAMYKKGEKSFSNLSLFILSSLVTVLFFPKEIAILALSFLVFGDTFAEIFGTKFGRLKIAGKKTIEGFLGGLSANLVIGLIWSIFLSVSPWLFIIGAFSASLIEITPLKIGKLKIDDNFSISVFSALVMLLISTFI